MDNHEHFMRMALNEAVRAWGNTAPNPMVGAVLVKDGKVVATGYHRCDGLDHAEKDCLRKVDFHAQGCDMYVTLEPCTTHGRTGACSEAIKKAGVKRVYVGCKDPNPLHAGRAESVFQEANIFCKFGILEDECRELNFIFNKNITSKQALLALKYAISKDGKITECAGRPTAITCDKSREDVMQWRKLFSAIGVGWGTVVADNPSLLARTFSGIKAPKARLIFDASLRSADADISKFNVFSDLYKNITRIVCDCSADIFKQEMLSAKGVDVMRINAPKNSSEFWTILKEQLYAQKICSLYLEGGASVYKSVCEAKAVDYVFEYVANKTFVGGLRAFDKNYFTINAVETHNICNDKFTRGYPVWKQIP